MRILFQLVILLTLAIGALGTMSPQGVASADVRQLDGALQTFKLELGRYPTEQEGLSALAQRPIDISEAKWSPYLRTVPAKDPWGHPYIYRFPGHHNPASYDVYSLGEDGVSKSGGIDEDDVNSWDTNRSWFAYYLEKQNAVIRKRQTRAFAWILLGGIVLSAPILLLAYVEKRSKVSA